MWRRDGHVRDVGNSARFHSRQLVKPFSVAGSTTSSAREVSPSRPLGAWPPRTWTWTWVHASIRGRARRDPSSLSHHCISQRLTHLRAPRSLLPPGEKKAPSFRAIPARSARAFFIPRVPVPRARKKEKGAPRSTRTCTRGRGETYTWGSAGRSSPAGHATPRRRHHRLRPIRPGPSSFSLLPHEC